MRAFWIGFRLSVGRAVLAVSTQASRISALINGILRKPDAPKQDDPLQVEDTHLTPDLGPWLTFDSRSKAEIAASHGNFAVAAPEGHQKWVFFSCPCGCGKIIALNLMSSASPVWKLETGKRGFYILCI